MVRLSLYSLGTVKNLKISTREFEVYQKMSSVL